MSLEAFLIQYGYFAFASVLIIAGFGVPIPEDIPLLFIGYLSAPANGMLNVWVTIAVAMACILGADGLFYFIGYTVRRRRNGELPTFVKRFLTPQRREQAEHYFSRYGARTVFFGRFLPGLRTPIFLCAGLWGVKPLRFLAADGGAALISVPTLVFVGYFFGDHMEDIKAIVGRVEYAIVAAIVIFAVGSFFAHRWRNKRLAQLNAQLSKPEP